MLLGTTAILLLPRGYNFRESINYAIYPLKNEPVKSCGIVQTTWWFVLIGEKLLMQGHLLRGLKLQCASMLRISSTKRNRSTSKAIDITFAHDILFEDFVMVASDSESDMSRWGFIQSDLMWTTLQNKEGVKLGPINSGQIYKKTQRYATCFMGSFSTGYSIVRYSP